MSVEYVLLGYGVTDDSGVAHMTHDKDGNVLSNPGYVGVGAGKLNVVAANKNPVDSGAVVSQPFQVTDGTFYDTGIDGTDKSDYWYLNRSNVTIVVGSDGTTITESNSSSYSIVVPNLTSTPTLNGSYVFDSPLAVEFDLISFDDGCGIRLYDKTNAYAPNFPNIITANSHVKIEVTGRKVIYYSNGETYEVNFTPTALLQCGFKVSAGNTLKFKNFVVYPI